MPGTDIVRLRIQPSMISHHSTILGNMINTLSPGVIPSPDIAFAILVDLSVN